MLFHTTVKKIIHQKGKEYHIWLEENPFHPEGGGQPGDSGEIRSGRFRGKVKDCEKDGNSKFLTVFIQEGSPETGEKVEVFLDDARNLVLSRSHTAQHLFSRVLEDHFEGLMTTKVNIHDHASTVYFNFDGDLTLRDMFDAEERVNHLIRMALEVKVLGYEYDTARSIDGLKAKWDLLSPEEPVKVVRIGDMDLNACAGTHVNRTDEIGGFIVLALKGRKPSWEVKYSLERQRICVEHSRILREFSNTTGLSATEILKTFRNLKVENQNLSSNIKNLIPFVSIPWNISSAGAYQLYYSNPESLPLEIVNQLSRRKIEEDPNSLVLAMVTGNERNLFNFVLRKGEKVELDLPALMDSMPELNVRGGGKGSFFSGITNIGSFPKWVDLISSRIKK